MNKETIEFQCEHCYTSFTAKLEDVKVIEHKASPCACVYCGWGGWTEYRTNCPKCDREINDI